MSQSLFTATGAFTGVNTQMKVNTNLKQNTMKTAPVMRASVNNAYSINHAPKSFASSRAAPSGVAMSMSASGASNDFGSAPKFKGVVVPTGNNYSMGGEAMNTDTTNWGQQQMPKATVNNGEYSQYMSELMN